MSKGKSRKAAGVKNAATTRGKPFEEGNPGRPKGSVNKTTKALKDAILEAAELAGGKGDDKQAGGLVGYLQKLADNQPQAFASLLGKVLPLQIAAEGKGGAFVITWAEPGSTFDPARDA